MKLIRCNGKVLEVWDIPSPAILRLSAGPAPIKAHGWHLLEDDLARAMIRRALWEGAVKLNVAEEK